MTTIMEWGVPTLLTNCDTIIALIIDEKAQVVVVSLLLGSWGAPG